MIATRAPGVYTIEVPSGLAPIAGTSTNTVGFIGVLTSTNLQVSIPVAVKGYNPQTKIGPQGTVKLKNQDGSSRAEIDVVLELTGQMLKDPKTVTTTVSILKKGSRLSTATIKKVIKAKKPTSGKPAVNILFANKISKAQLAADDILLGDVKESSVSYGAGHKLDASDVSRIQSLALISEVPVQRTVSITRTTDEGQLSEDYLNNWMLDQDVDLSSEESIEFTIPNDRPLDHQEASALFQSFKSQTEILIKADSPYREERVTLQLPVGTPQLCTNFSEFKQLLYGNQLEKGPDGNPRSLSGFPTPKKDSDHKKLSRLIHAVYGFFSNGGTRCYVMAVQASSLTSESLSPLDAIEEISIVTAPGITKTEQEAITAYCTKGANEGNFYRFAMFDCQENEGEPNASLTSISVPGNTDYAAFYYPWIKVADPATKVMQPEGDGLLAVPPSGHIAGVYARVDNLRGVHKAPANEVIFGALGVTRNISKNQQAGLNPQGINCIRDLNGNIRIWGARTVGGEANGEFTYISTRRLFLYLRHSIDKATQWTVFEPNNPELWAKIRRNITAFLTTTWQSGALFGVTPDEAFYVKCDAENNPPSVRDLGQVVIEIGVAVTKPAEFVIFRISQWTGSGT